MFLLYYSKYIFVNCLIATTDMSCRTNPKAQLIVTSCQQQFSQQLSDRQSNHVNGDSHVAALVTNILTTNNWKKIETHCDWHKLPQPDKTFKQLMGWCISHHKYKLSTVYLLKCNSAQFKYIQENADSKIEIIFTTKFLWGRRLVQIGTAGTAARKECTKMYMTWAQPFTQWQDVLICALTT